MIVYIILAEICLTIGTPSWVLTLCWIGLALRAITAIMDVAKTIKELDDKYIDELVKLLK